MAAEFTDEDVHARRRGTPVDQEPGTDEPSLAEGAVALIFLALLAVLGLGLFGLLLR